MLNIVIPMAGRGSRFYEAGYTIPKPLIPIRGKPMIDVIVNNLRPCRPHRFIFLCLQEHLDQFDVANHLHTIQPTSMVVPVKHVTEGAACTVLLARDLIDNDQPMMCANSDQWVDADINAYLDYQDTEHLDGLIMTMWADHTKWSYARVNDARRVTETVEKEVVSNEATVGIYNYQRGRDFVRAAESMIAKNLRVNNEFYVAPVYNQLIAEGQAIGYYNVGKVEAGMYGLGVPSDLDSFLASSVCEKATRF